MYRSIRLHMGKTATSHKQIRILITKSAIFDLVVRHRGVNMDFRGKMSLIRNSPGTTG